MPTARIASTVGGSCGTKFIALIIQLARPFKRSAPNLPQPSAVEIAYRAVETFIIHQTTVAEYLERAVVATSNNLRTRCGNSLHHSDRFAMTRFAFSLSDSTSRAALMRAASWESNV